MAVYFVDDGGSATAPFDTWEKAAPTLASLLDAITIASDDIVYIGADSVSSGDASGADQTFTGSTSGSPVYVISSTVGTGTTVSYSPSTSNQVDTSSGPYRMQFAGGWAFYGVCFNTGSYFQLYPTGPQTVLLESCTIKVAAAGYFEVNQNGFSKAVINKCTIDCAGDTSLQSLAPMRFAPSITALISDLAFTNVTFRRQAAVFLATASGYRWVQLSGADCSGFTNTDTMPIVSGSFQGLFTASNIKTKTNPVIFNADPVNLHTNIMLTNCGPTDAPATIYHRAYEGNIASSSMVYRNGGATVEGDPTSWLVTTPDKAIEGRPYYSPWMYGTAEVGSKTAVVHITNDTAAFTDAEVWLEVEYLREADDPRFFYASDHRTITTPPQPQDTDTNSTWAGADPAFTFKQELRVTVTVGQAGQYRARVAVGVPSIAASRYFFVDPKVEVT